MIKRIITFVVCIALCVSCIAVGVVNQKAKDSSVEATADGAIEGVVGATIPTAPAAKDGAIEKVSDTEFNLTGNVTVSSQSELSAVEAVINAGGTFDGKGYTLTLNNLTEPLFTELKGGGTIQNLVVDGNASFSTTAYSGIFAHSTVSGDFDFTNVIVKATVAFGVTQPNGAFVGAIVGGTTTFNNCVFAGTLKTIEGSSGISVAGFVGQNNTPVIFNDCTASGTINADCHIGGFVNTTYKGNTTFNRCYSNTYIDVANDVTPVSTGGAGGFVGYISRAEAIVAINDSVSEATILDGGASGGIRYTGGFIGRVYKSNNISATNSVSNCVFELAEGFVGKGYVGGFVGDFLEAYARTFGFENCVNNSDIDWTKNATLDVCYGGFVGIGGAGISANFTNCENNGDVYIKTTESSTVKAGGFIGIMSANSPNGKINVTNCSNNGSITIEGAATGSDLFAAGFLASVDTTAADKVGTFTLNGFINTGDMTVTGATAGAAGITCSLTGGGTYSGTATNCVNLGNIQVNNAAGTGTCVDTIAETGCTSIVATEMLSAVTAMVDGKCSATVDMDTYNAIVAKFGAENVEFGAIITLKNYVDKIGELTHADFDAYLEANKTTNAKLADIDALYMIASLIDGHTVEKDVNITLENATENVEYVARTYVKIGNAYIYSK